MISTAFRNTANERKGNHLFIWIIKIKIIFACVIIVSVKMYGKCLFVLFGLCYAKLQFSVAAMPICFVAAGATSEILDCKTQRLTAYQSCQHNLTVLQ